MVTFGLDSAPCAAAGKEARRNGAARHNADRIDTVDVIGRIAFLHDFASRKSSLHRANGVIVHEQKSTHEAQRVSACAAHFITLLLLIFRNYWYVAERLPVARLWLRRLHKVRRSKSVPFKFLYAEAIFFGAGAGRKALPARSREQVNSPASSAA